MSILLVILGLVLFVCLVVVHEFGHFIAARRNGVEVEEFGIGFPPKAKTLANKKGTEYTLNWLPLGGFVRLKGEHDAATETGTYGAASLLTKVKIMLAGVVMNLGAAFVLLTLLALVGMPVLLTDPQTGENIQYTVPSDTHIVSNQVLVGFVGEGSPAASAGIAQRDVLIGYIDPVAICAENPCINTFGSSEDLVDFTAKNGGNTVQLVVEHNGQETTKTIQLRSAAEITQSEHLADEKHDPSLRKGYLGVSPTEYTVQRSTWSAPIVAAGLIKQMTQLTLGALKDLVVNLAKGHTAQATESVAGPVGIFVLIKDGSLLGYQFILMIIAVISLTLAIMNALPIPALDGGRLFVTLLFRVFGKPLSKDTEERIHGTGFVVLMVLFVLITIVDIRRFF